MAETEYSDREDASSDTNLMEFKEAYSAKKKLMERQEEDFLFRLGNQWDKEKYQALKDKGVEPVTDNRIQPIINLLGGMERQNRSEFKAFPEGEEDSLKAEIATSLFKDIIKKSDFGYKFSDMYEDGITCGEAYLEFWIDNTYDLLNGKPCWKKLNYNDVFPEPGATEYDLSDARYIFKLTRNLSKDDLISLFPEKRKTIQRAEGGSFDLDTFLSSDEYHVQPKDYGKDGESGDKKKKGSFDLLEKYYKKNVMKFIVGDFETGELKEAENEEKANAFIQEYQNSIFQEQQMYEVQMAEFQVMQQQMSTDPMVALAMEQGAMPQEPIAPTPRDPERFKVIKRYEPEIWYCAQVPGIKSKLAEEKAWFFPKSKRWPIIPYFADFSTAPLTGDDRHLLVQGLVHRAKGSQRKHNSVETLQYLHLNGAANSGWLAEEGAWLDEKKVESLGATPGVNLTYKSGKQKPERIFPMALSQGHAQLSETSAEAIKAQTGINADLLAVQEGGQSSGRAIALRQRQGVLMVQKYYDNGARTKQLCGRFSLTQLGELYDTETAKKVLGDAFLINNFPPEMELVEDEMGNPVIDPNTGLPQEKPVIGKDGQPMKYDSEMAELVIAEVLSGNLEQYDVSVGEAVASETMKMANAAEIKELATMLPGFIAPEIIVEESQMSQATKQRILKRAQAMMMQPPPTPNNKPAPKDAPQEVAA